MNEQDTRSRIIQAANQLFHQYGYQRTGMRDIAAASGVSLGNVQYYFPKKVQLMSEVYALTISNYFKSQKVNDVQSEIPIVNIMVSEYRFMRAITSVPISKESYIATLGAPEICNVYIEKSTELCMETNAFPNTSPREILLANTVMYGGMFQLFHFYLSRIHEYSFDELIAQSFKVRLCLLNIENCDDLISSALENSRKLETLLERPSPQS